MEDRCAAHCERSWKFFVAVLKCEINVVLDNRSHPRDARLVEAKVCRASDMNWLLFEVVVAAPVAENVVRGSSVSHLFAAGNAVGRNSVGVIAVGSAPAAAGASNDIDGRGYTQILKSTTKDPLGCCALIFSVPTRQADEFVATAWKESNFDGGCSMSVRSGRRAEAQQWSSTVIVRRPSPPV